MGAPDVSLDEIMKSAEGTNEVTESVKQVEVPEASPEDEEVK